MASIQVETTINADLQACFDLVRNIDFHQESLKYSV